MKIKVEYPFGVTDRYGKQIKPYIAKVSGEDEKWVLARSFLRVKPDSSGEMTLPQKDGVYEVRDYPAGPGVQYEKRNRYFQVIGQNAVDITDDALDTDAVLDAVEASATGVWYAMGNGSPAAGRPTAREALDELNRVMETFRMVKGDVLMDSEDVCMELDHVRVLLERMAGEE